MMMMTMTVRSLVKINMTSSEEVDIFEMKAVVSDKGENYADF